MTHCEGCKRLACVWYGCQQDTREAPMDKLIKERRAIITAGVAARIRQLQADRGTRQPPTEAQAARDREQIARANQVRRSK